MDILRVEIQQNKIKHLKKSIYEDYKLGLLSKEEFIDYKTDYDKQEKNMNDLILKMKESQITEEPLLESEFIKNLKNTSQIQKVDRTILETFYEKIIIYEDKKIKLKYKFQKFIDSISKY